MSIGTNVIAQAIIAAVTDGNVSNDEVQKIKRAVSQLTLDYVLRNPARKGLSIDLDKFDPVFVSVERDEITEVTLLLRKVTGTITVPAPFGNRPRVSTFKNKDCKFGASWENGKLTHFNFGYTNL